MEANKGQIEKAPPENELKLMDMVRGRAFTAFATCQHPSLQAPCNHAPGLSKNSPAHTRIAFPGVLPNTQG